MSRPWIAFYSQTGKEIVNLSRRLGRWPDVIVVNDQFDPDSKVPGGRVCDLKYEYNHSCLEIRERARIHVKSRPSETTLRNILSALPNALITLHGWLRIMPPSICEEFEIYNGHPGLITEYPQLKGFNPQEKAHKLELPVSGCVIHRVEAGVDEGEIVACSEYVDIKGKELGEVYDLLSEKSLDLWYTFLKEHYSI